MTFQIRGASRLANALLNPSAVSRAPAQRARIIKSFLLFAVKVLLLLRVLHGRRRRLWPKIAIEQERIHHAHRLAFKTRLGRRCVWVEWSFIGAGSPLKVSGVSFVVSLIDSPQNQTLIGKRHATCRIRAATPAVMGTEPPREIPAVCWPCCFSEPCCVLATQVVISGRNFAYLWPF